MKTYNMKEIIDILAASPLEEPWLDWRSELIKFDDMSELVYAIEMGQKICRAPWVFNGIEVPYNDFKPGKTELHIKADPSSYAYYRKEYECSSLNDAHLQKHGMTYPDTPKGLSAAIHHAKAMLGVTE